jgi:hypothetical protein
LSVAWEAGTYMFVSMLARGYLEGVVPRATRPTGSELPRYETLASVRGAAGA